MAETIEDLIAAADGLTERGEYEASLALLRKAVGMVPEPFEEHEESATLIGAIGDNYFFLKEFEKARQAYTDIMLIGDSPANPYVRLRRGQIALELGDRKSAGTELACAYMNGGIDIFEGEDPKYLDIVKTLLPKEFGG